MSTASTNGDTTGKNLQLEAEGPARLAEEAHRKYESLGRQFAKLGRQQLEVAIEAGLNLIKAKEIVGHGNFEKEQKRWRTNGTITFSGRSCRRYVRLADHADALKMANVANIRDAERYIASLKAGEEAAGRGDAEVSTPSDNRSADLVTQVETRVLNDMRRLERDEQRSFLEGLIARLSNRLGALEA